MKTTVSGLLLDSKGLQKRLQDWQLLKDLGLISLEETSSALHGLRLLDGLFCLEKCRRFFVLPQLKSNMGKKQLD